MDAQSPMSDSGYLPQEKTKRDVKLCYLATIKCQHETLSLILKIFCNKIDDTPNVDIFQQNTKGHDDVNTEHTHEFDLHASIV